MTAGWNYFWGRTVCVSAAVRVSCGTSFALRLAPVFGGWERMLIFSCRRWSNYSATQEAYQVLCKPGWLMTQGKLSVLAWVEGFNYYLYKR